MDLLSLKAEAIEKTKQSFLEKNGFAPDPDSEEWEEEYRRQFALAKARCGAADRPANGAPARSSVAQPAASSAGWPALSGPPSQARWAETLRAERLKDVAAADLRSWLIRSWTATKDWIDTRGLPAPAFLRRIEAEYAEHRRKAKEEAAVRVAGQQAREAAAAAIAEHIHAAGITAQGLIELVDVSPRVKTRPATVKLAELTAGERRLRVFETANPKALLVIESGTTGRTEYGIERDEGLVADLKLYGQVNL